VSATAVAIAAEFTYLRRRRLLHTGMLEDTEETLVHDLSEAVHSGLDHISHAASELAHSFADARRELVRFGLDPLSAGSHDGSAWYYEDEDDAPRKSGGSVGPDYEQDWASK
jgi:gamma-glutamyl:cysteine ligase YbdK (ATP-grasp superfamily)